MFYKNIYIRDFGIFSNQNLNDISKKLVVIGGHNRAGKSSFLKLLRHLPFGLPQDSSIPPASNQYYIEAEMKRESKSYNLFLEGYAAPKILDEKQNKIKAAEIFNYLDQLSYQQLFTISLDELQQLSKITKGKKKEKRLFSILLGAGLSELVKVPELADKYYNYAKNIGGTLGDPSVASFKPYFNEIQEAEALRDQALLEIKEFNLKKEKLNTAKQNLEALNQKIIGFENEIFLLDLLKNNYSILEEIENLQVKLEQSSVQDQDCNNYLELDQIVNYQQNFDKIKKELQSKRNDLNKSVKSSYSKKFLEFIKNNKNQINNQQQKIDLLNEKIKNFRTQKMKITNEYQTLILELENLNSNWQQPLKKLETINLDLIEAEKFNNYLNKNETLKAEVKSITAEIDKLGNEIKNIEADISAFDYKTPNSILKTTYSILILSFFVLSSSFFIDYNQIKYFALLIAGAAFIYYSSNYKSSKLEKEKADKLEKELSQKNDKLNFYRKDLTRKNKNLKKVQNNLSDFSNLLGLENIEVNGDLSYLKSYFLEIKAKKRRFKKLKIEEEEKSKLKDEILLDLKNIYDLIKETANYYNDQFMLSSVLETKTSDLISKSQFLFKELNKLSEMKELAEKYLDKKREFELLQNQIYEFLGDFERENKLELRLESYQKKAEAAAEYKKNKKNYDSQKSQIKHILAASDKTKKILNQKDSDKNYYQLFLKLYRDFSSLNAVESEKNSYEELLFSSKKKKNKLEEKIITFKNKIEELASSSKIENAQIKIDQAQNNLEKRAQRYAVNKSVYFILKKLRERMVEKAEKELLKPASNILAEITDNYYNKLETGSDLEASEFQAVTKSGKKFNSVEQLSQGSLEQLFLAVRISRIKEIKPPLPLILDDSLVNFDSKHLYNTAEIISNLSNNHQIFILSCHPHLVKYISEISNSAQYWKLEVGNFELSSSQKLISHLSL
jgi:uncharacterized protein YhaN